MNIHWPQIHWPRLPLPAAVRRWSLSFQPIALVHWDRSALYYFVVGRRGNAIQQLAAGSLNRVAESEPLVQLAAHLQTQKIDCRHVVVLLSRSDLDLSTLNLPPAEPEEIPSLVATEVEQQLGDRNEPPVVDYLVTQWQAGQSAEVLAFSLSSELIARWRDSLRPTNLRLAAITSRQLAPLGILRRRGELHVPFSVAISIYSGEVELILCRRDSPLFVRTLRVSSDDPRALAEQIVLEIQRCVALTSGLDRVGAPDLLILGREDEHRALIEALQEHPLGSLKRVHPLSDWPADQRINEGGLGTPSPEGGVTASAEAPGAAGAPVAAEAVGGSDLTDASNAVATPAVSRLSSRVDAALAGAAWDYVHESLAIDLLAPRRPPVPPNPRRRWTAIGAGAATLVVAVAYYLASDVADLRSAVADREKELSGRQRVANKVLEKSDEAGVVEQWLSDQVDWLDELQTVAQNLPDARHATIRRLTASAATEGGIIDLAVQVSDPERLAELESGLRAAEFSVTSRRVSQQALSDEYPWQFETRATFSILSPKSKLYRAPDARAPNTAAGQATAGAAGESP